MSGDENDSTRMKPAEVGAGGAAPEPGAKAAKPIEEVVQPLAVAVMLTCIAVALSQLIVVIVPTWPGYFFAVVTFLVAVESMGSLRQLDRREFAGRDRLRFHFVEWVVILLVIRFGVYLSYGMARLMSDMQLWSSNAGAFVDAGFAVQSILMLVVWLVARSVARALAELRATPLEHVPSVTDPNYYLRSTMPSHGQVDRQERVRGILNFVFWGGALLLILSAMARVDVRQLVTLSHPRSSGIIVNALVFFITGLLLISQIQYATLKAGWELQEVPIAQQLGRRWVMLVLGLLVTVAIVATLLPVSYSVGILGTLSMVIQWVIYLLLRILFGIYFVLSFLFGLILSLFRGTSLPATTPPPQAPMAPQAPVADSGDPAAWWQLLRSLIFWLVLLGVAGYSIYHFMGDRWGLFRNLSARRMVQWFARMLRRARRRVRRTVQEVREALARRRAERPAPVHRRRYRSLRGMSPRQRVRFFYLAVLERGAEVGLARPPAMTPLEYEQTLTERMPEVSEEFRGLSAAFVEARYTAHEVDAGVAGAVQNAWRQIQRALRLRKRAQAQQAAEPPKKNRHRQP
ncbi:MAG: DUF4129 domain-containing protein [Anaerolineae bacterium]